MTTKPGKPVTLGDLYSTPELLSTLHDEATSEGWNDVMWVRWAAYLLRYHGFEPSSAQRHALEQWRALPGFQELPRLPALVFKPSK